MMYKPMHQFKLKRTAADASRSIIVSFHSNWYEPLTQGNISVIFRKMTPRDFTPDWIYAYFAAPVSAIAAKLPVIRTDEMHLDQAVELVDEGCISENELRTYAERWHELVVYRVGQVSIAKNPITHHLLATEYDFFASATFIPLSKIGKSVLDRLGQFESRQPKKHSDTSR